MLQVRFDFGQLLRIEIARLGVVAERAAGLLDLDTRRIDQFAAGAQLRIEFRQPGQFGAGTRQAHA